MSQKRKRTPSPVADDPDVSGVFQSDSIYDRSSTFIAHFSTTVPSKTLQKTKAFESASHRILAWRRQSQQQSIRSGPSGPKQLFVTGSDDDGEKYGGKQLEKVLEAENVEGAVVVARWYGGVLLGPVRFTHIETCAKEAIHQWKTAVAQEETKRRCLETEEHEKQRLRMILGERDQSIITLRSLLALKTANMTKEGSNEPPSPSTHTNVTPTRVIDYSILPLQRLRALEKARDASITFLLKEIDKTEEQQQPP
ncbi:MAG: hypothetical protein M1822_004138 [Bathelium mastoideum]|nr:MAG: hypothetical protein M1822_004138 [Bathelium mastoideum]